MTNLIKAYSSHSTYTPRMETTETNSTEDKNRIGRIEGGSAASAINRMECKVKARFSVAIWAEEVKETVRMMEII